jgi:anaerobic ribonucleoside-triphosphate reductase/predicted transcriptional regulator
MEMHDTSLKDLAKKLSALDNEVKLKILTRLIKEGAKSITDISKELNLTFSTAHKYLEQLEKANLVTSKQVTENRQKRLFYITDFGIDLSPKGLVDIGKQAQDNKSKFRLINECGDLVNFNEKIFSKKYTEIGLPYSAIETAIRNLEEHGYDGITLFELRGLFNQALKKQMRNIQEVYEKLNVLRKHKRTYSSILKIIHEEALEQHMNGDIFIQYLHKPQILHTVHSIRSIGIHGIYGKRPENLKDLFKHAEKILDLSSAFSRGSHTFESFNYYIAPFIESDNLKQELTTFLTNLNKINNTIYINLDIGDPRFSSKPTKLEKDVIYADYKEKADDVTKAVVNILQNENLQNISPIFKLWGSNSLPEYSKPFYIANTSHDWQRSNVSYAGEHARFDTMWKDERSSRVGEIQSITINLPRIALNSKSEDEFFKKYKNLIGECLEYTYHIVEIIHGAFLRKHNITLPSATQKRWNLVCVDDSSYSIAITGLNDVVKILSGKPIEENFELAEKILQFSNTTLKELTKIHVRLCIKENLDPIVAERFNQLDKRKSKTYSLGAQCNNLEMNAKLQKLLPGGHCTTINKNQIEEFLNSEGGLAKCI